MRKEEAGRNRSFEYGKLLKRKKYFALIGLLVLVDWVANVPVFQQVLPQEPGAEQAWLDIADRASRVGSFARLVRTFERIAFQLPWGGSIEHRYHFAGASVSGVSLAILSQRSGALSSREIHPISWPASSSSISNRGPVGNVRFSFANWARKNLRPRIRRWEDPKDPSSEMRHIDDQLFRSGASIWCTSNCTRPTASEVFRSSQKRLRTLERGPAEL
jgi:hypothetical protein